MQQEQKRVLHSTIAQGFWLASDVFTAVFTLAFFIIRFAVPYRYTNSWVISFAVYNNVTATQSGADLGFVVALVALLFLTFAIRHDGFRSIAGRYAVYVRLAAFDVLLLGKLAFYLKNEWNILHKGSLYGPMALMLVLFLHLVLLFLLPGMRAPADATGYGEKALARKAVAKAAGGLAAGFALLFCVAYGLGAVIYMPFGDYRVRFENPLVEQAVKQALDVPEGVALRKSDLAAIQFLSLDAYECVVEMEVPGQAVEQSLEDSSASWMYTEANGTLRDLRHFTGLKGLALYGYGYNLWQAQANEGLEYLYVYNRERQSSPTSGLVTGALAGFAKMQTLVLEGAVFEDTSFAGQLPDLQVLVLRRCYVNTMDMGDFSPNTHLKVLELEVSSGAGLEVDLSRLSALQSLQAFGLGYKSGETLHVTQSMYLTGVDSLLALPSLAHIRLSMVDVNERDFGLLYSLPEGFASLERINQPDNGRLDEWDVYLDGYYEIEALNLAGETEKARQSIELRVPATVANAGTIQASITYTEDGESFLALSSGAVLAFGQQATVLRADGAKAAYALLGRWLYRISPMGETEYIDEVHAYVLSPSGNVLYYTAQDAKSGEYQLMRLEAEGAPEYAGEAALAVRRYYGTTQLERVEGARFSYNEQAFVFLAADGSWYRHMAGEREARPVIGGEDVWTMLGVSDDGGQAYWADDDNLYVYSIPDGEVLYTTRDERHAGDGVNSFILGEGSTCIALLENGVVFWDGSRGAFRLMQAGYVTLPTGFAWVSARYSAFARVYSDGDTYDGGYPYPNMYIAAKGYPMDTIVVQGAARPASGIQADFYIYSVCVDSPQETRLGRPGRDKGFTVSEDGGRVTWIDEDTHELLQWQAGTGDTAVLWQDVYDFAASADGCTLYFLGDGVLAEDADSLYWGNVYRLDVDTMEVQTIAENTSASDVAIMLHTTPDGESFIYRSWEDGHYAWHLNLAGEDIYLCEFTPGISFGKFHRGHIPEDLVFFYTDRYIITSHDELPNVYLFNGEEGIEIARQVQDVPARNTAILRDMAERMQNSVAEDEAETKE